MRKLNIFEYAAVWGIIVALVCKAVTSGDWVTSIFIGMIVGMFAFHMQYIEENRKANAVTELDNSKRHIRQMLFQEYDKIPNYKMDSIIKEALNRLIDRADEETLSELRFYAKKRIMEEKEK